MATMFGSDDNEHPFECNGCGLMYRGHRYAAKCCQIGSTDKRDGTVCMFSIEFEAAAAAAEDLKWKAIYARAHYECSCGESFDEIDHAIMCRKCRTYTPEGLCTAVVDRDQDGKVVWRIDG
jgi:ribosomal protein S26